MTPIWVLPEAVLSIHQMLLSEHGGLSGIRDHSLLDSALAHPKQLLAYEDDISIFDLAASYSFSLAKNYPFIDGNKRVALTVAAVFLELNGYSLNAPEPEAVLIYEQLASGYINETNLSVWLKDSSISIA